MGQGEQELYKIPDCVVNCYANCFVNVIGVFGDINFDSSRIFFRDFMCTFLDQVNYDGNDFF